MVTALSVFSLGLATFRLNVDVAVSARAMPTDALSTFTGISRLMVIISYPPTYLETDEVGTASYILRGLDLVVDSDLIVRSYHAHILL